jgi:hypothetical protein
VGSEATANAAGRAICERTRRGNILCNESFLGALKFLLEVQSWELTLRFLLLASVREGVASDSTSLLLHCASRLATAPRCAWLAVITPQLALLVRFLAGDSLLLWL